MSLILEALRKLDREKQAPERGLLVMAAAPWPSSSRGGVPALVFGLLVAMGAGAAVAYWLLRPAPASAPGSVVTAVAPSAPAIGTALPAAASTTPAEASFPIEPPAPTPFPTAAHVSTRAESRSPAIRPVAEPPAPSAASVGADALAEPETAASAGTAPREPISASAVPHLAPPFTLEAISIRDGAPIAVINGRLLHEGDVANGIRVIKIDAESVELEIRGVRQVIRF